MRLWQAMLVGGAAWVGTLATSAAQDAPAPAPDTAVDAGTDTAADEITADDPAAAETTTSETANAGDSAVDPVAAEIGALIEQLGAREFDDRERAVAELKRIGEPALAALRRALENGNAEVASRADVVIRHLQRPPEAARLPSPAQRRGHGAGFAVAGGVRVHMRVENDTRTIEVAEQGRTINIIEGPDGIRMSVSGEIDGKKVTREFVAPTPDQLRRENAEAFELYDRFAGRGGVPGLQGRGAHLILPGGGLVRRAIPGGAGIVRIGPGDVEVGLDPLDRADDLNELGELLERQMEDADMPLGQRRQIAGLLDRMRQARRGRDPLADGDEIHREMDNFNRQADALRDRLKELKLPDPGEALPPPAGARLGIEVLEDPDEGVTVLHVIPDARAQRIGLEPLDVISKVNGQAVTDAKQLRRAVMDAKGPLVIEGTRDGEPLKLEEKTRKDPAGAPGEKPALDGKER